MFIEYRGKVPQIAASAFIAPTAVLVGDVTVGEDASIWFGVVLRADSGAIRIGDRSSIEDNAVIHAGEHGTTIVGNDVTVGHCAVLDECVIEDHALVGSNAVVLNGARVGARSVVAAGSVVTSEAPVAADVVAAGAPATTRKRLAGRAAAWIAHSAQDGVVQSRAYRRDGLGDPLAHETKSPNRRAARAVVADRHAPA
jgi:carbonic anhydrase/acetyltransferase-like protein (isoleucine patch superfamily)